MKEELVTVPIAEMITGIIISLSFFAGVVLSLHYYLRARNRERMALIERGVDLSNFYKKPGDGHGLFKIALFFAGVGIGLFMGYILTLLTSIEEEVAYFSMILLFAAFGLVSYYIWFKKLLAK